MALVLATLVLVALVLATLVLFAGWTRATSTPASSTSATFLAAPVPITFFCVLCPKNSTGLKKLAPTGWHGWHVFATLLVEIGKAR